MIPSNAFIEIRPRKDDEHAKGDDLLDDLELKRCEFPIADPIRGYLKAVLREGDQPTHDDGGKKGCVAIFQMSVPREGHEDV